MTIHAVIGRWFTSREHQPHEVILPVAQAHPGFLTGYWTADPESGRTHATILFDGEHPARSFKALLDSDRQHTATLGIINEYLIVTALLAQADRTQP